VIENMAVNFVFITYSFFVSCETVFIIPKIYERLDFF